MKFTDLHVVTKSVRVLKQGVARGRYEVHWTRRRIRLLGHRRCDDIP
jgi:hypothetical protein